MRGSFKLQRSPKVVSLDQMLSENESGVFKTKENGTIVMLPRSHGAKSGIYVKKTGEVLSFQPSLWTGESFYRVDNAGELVINTSVK